MPSLAEATDRTLLNDFSQTRNSSAFTEISRRYVDFVYAAALRQTNGDHANAADVTQAVFVVLTRRAATIRPHALPTWLHRVTAYAAKNVLRAETARRRHERAAAIQRHEATMSAERFEIDPLLDRAIASLPAKDQTVVIERFLCGRDLADVAALVGASTTATQKRLERAVGRLRRFFQRHGIVLGAATVPWPSLHAAPILLSGSSAIVSPHSLAGKIMSHLLWSKLVAVGATAAIVALVVGTASVEISHLARADPPATIPSANTALIARLSGGTTLSIESVFDVASPGRCWLPDGTPIANPPWRMSHRLDDNPRSDHGVPMRKFGVIVRVQSSSATPAKLATFYFDDNFGADGGFTPSIPEKLGGQWSGLTTSFPQNDATAKMRFVVSNGDFAKSPIPPSVWGGTGGSNINGHTPAGDYLISKPFLRDGVVAVTISSAVDGVDDRLEATIADARGTHSVIGTIVDGQSVNAIRQQIETFPGVSDPQSIRSIDFEYRPLEWAEFRNVSLRSGEPSRAQISTGIGYGPPPTEVAPTGEVYIGGDTPRPGVYPLSKTNRTLYQILDLAEATAHLQDHVRVTRNVVGTQTIIIDNVPLDRLLSDKTNDIPLKPDDVIVVVVSPK